MPLGVCLSRCHAVCVSAALVSAAKVMRCIQCSLIILLFCAASRGFLPGEQVGGDDVVTGRRSTGTGPGARRGRELGGRPARPPACSRTDERQLADRSLPDVLFEGDCAG